MDNVVIDLTRQDLLTYGVSWVRIGPGGIAERIDPNFVSLATADEMNALDKAKADYEILTSDYEELAHEVLDFRADRVQLTDIIERIRMLALDNDGPAIVALIKRFYSTDSGEVGQ